MSAHVHIYGAYILIVISTDDVIISTALVCMLYTYTHTHWLYLCKGVFKYCVS